MSKLYVCNIYEAFYLNFKIYGTLVKGLCPGGGGVKMAI